MALKRDEILRILNNIITVLSAIFDLLDNGNAPEDKLFDGKEADRHE